MGTFENPVWTVTEVMDMYIFYAFIILVLVWFFFSFLIEAIKDIHKFIKTLIMENRNAKTPDVDLMESALKQAKKVKNMFLIYFDGCYDIEAVENTSNTFAMGVCKLEYKNKENELTVHLRRPGLLIGKGGRTIDALAKQLECKIGIVEVNLWK